MSAMLLDDDEIEALTKRVRPHAQVRRLRELGIEHKPRPGDCPAVLRSHVEHLLGGKTPAKVTDSEPVWGPIA